MVCNLGCLNVATVKEKCPCFSAQELEEEISQIKDFAAAEGGTTREMCESRSGFVGKGPFVFVDVTALEPDDTQVYARVSKPFGPSELGSKCTHNHFLRDVALHPSVNASNLNGDEFQACVVDILSACAKTQSQNGQ